MYVYRCNISKYQAANYAQKERNIIEKLGLTYLPPELSPTIQPDIVITNSNTVLSAQSFDWSKIKLLIHPNSGYDNIKETIIKQIQDGPIILGNPLRANAVTTYCLQALFNAFTSPPTHLTWDHQREWNRINMDQLNILLIGHGHIGTLINQSLRPIVKQLDIYDPYRDAPSQIAELTNLSHYHAIILAPSLNHSSHHIVNQDFLHQVRSNAVIINAARGKLIHQQALIQFLKDNPHAKAYIDVFENEPADFSEWSDLISSKQAHLTSHIAGVYKNLDQKILEFVETTISDFLTLNQIEFKEHYQSLILQEKMKTIPLYGK
jgi:D-3-phosphoglycerate dehydrogenase